MLRILYILIFTTGIFYSPAILFAQQVFISNVEVRYKHVGAVGSDGNGYCNDITASDPAVSYMTSGGNVWQDSSLIEFERPNRGNGNGLYPGSCLGLCATVVCVSTVGAFAIDELNFEIFKFGVGANPLDAGSTPPLKTINLYNIGTCSNAAYPAATTVGTYCAAWDGMYNINGMFGKTNGQYGFRATVRTTQSSPITGTINVQQTTAFPGQNQIPIQVNVTNIHSVRSTPTVVGQITGVAAQPYNILYRLSKDSVVTLRIFDASVAGSLPLVRTVVSTLPRVGEGVPNGTLTNGDFWDGRNNYGKFVPAGNYLAQIDAWSNDMWATTDLAFATTVQINVVPLQIVPSQLPEAGKRVVNPT